MNTSGLAEYNYENLDLNELAQQICFWLTQIDIAGESRMTDSLKSKLVSDDGKISPCRIEYLYKETHEIYQQFLEKKERPKGVYTLYFEGMGYDGLNHIVITKRDPLTWVTSEVGKGYTTTANRLPEWLEKLFELNAGQWQITRRSETDLAEGVYTFVESKKSEQIVLGRQIFSAEITCYERSHENSPYCAFYAFSFSEKEGGDFFGKFLKMKEQEIFNDCNQLLEWLKKYNPTKQLLEFENLHLLDKRYALFSRRITNDYYRLPFIEERREKANDALLEALKGIAKTELDKLDSNFQHYTYEKSDLRQEIYQRYLTLDVLKKVLDPLLPKFS